MNKDNNNNMKNLKKGTVLNSGYMYSQELVYISEGPCGTLECIGRESGKPFRIPNYGEDWKVSEEVVSSDELTYLESMKSQFLEIESLEDKLLYSKKLRARTRGLFNFMQLEKINNLFVNYSRGPIKSMIVLSMAVDDEGNWGDIILAFSPSERVTEKELLRALKESKNLRYMDLATQEHTFYDRRLHFGSKATVRKVGLDDHFLRDMACASIMTCCPLREVLIEKIRRSEMIEDLVKERDGGTVSPLGENELKEVLEIAKQLSKGTVTQ